MPPGAGGKVDFPLLYEKTDPLAAGRSEILESGSKLSYQLKLTPWIKIVLEHLRSESLAKILARVIF